MLERLSSLVPNIWWFSVAASQRRLGLQQGHGEALTGVGPLQPGLGGLEVEAVAADALFDGVGLRVVLGVVDLAFQGLVESGQVDVLVGQHLIVPRSGP